MLTSGPTCCPILAVNAESVARYLNAQIDAGAQAVMVFDSWGGVLADGAFQTFSLAYTQAVLRQLKRDADGRPRASHRLHKRRAVAGSDRRDRRRCRRRRLDGRPRLGAPSRRHRHRAAGQPRPGGLFGGDDAIRREAAQVLARFGPHESDGRANGHVFNPATASASTRRPRPSRCWSKRCTRGRVRRARRDVDHEPSACKSMICEHLEFSTAPVDNFVENAAGGSKRLLVLLPDILPAFAAGAGLNEINDLRASEESVMRCNRASIS